MIPARKRTKTDHPSTDQNQGRRRAVTIPLPRRATLLAARERQARIPKLNTLPFDVLGEISDHLHPRDLLNLALTSKRITRCLLHPRQEYIWRNARLRTVEPPKKPPFLNERAFARFLYSRRCNHCGEVDVVVVRWTWFARYCSDCLPKARYDGKSAYDIYYASCEYLRDNEDLQELVNVMSPSRIHDTFTKKGNYVQRRQLDQFLRDWQEADTEEAQHEFLKQQKALVRRRQKYSELCHRWYQTAGLAERREAVRLMKHKRS